MEIDNSSYVFKNRKRMYIYTIAVAIILPIILLSEWFDKPIFGLSRHFFAAIILIIYLTYYVIRYFLNLNFVQVSVASNKLSLKYYSLRPLTKSHNSIEIPLQAFEGYKINTRFFGLKKDLILFQRVQGKIAKYPPVSLSALNKKQLEQLLILLNAVSQKK
ncbi:MAG: hypothetical protein N2662_12560 [Bacteroidales bacterium]|nr:hypothetical protein [Bacteroidales bacterium]